jgi:hypothetical protein
VFEHAFDSDQPIRRRTMTSPIPQGVATLLGQARTTWAEAALESRPAERYRAAHIAALRAAAALLALRARPAATIRRRPTSAWVLLDQLAPELAEWSAYFADSAVRRAAIEAGSLTAVTERDADDLLRAAGEFVAIVDRMVGVLQLSVAS